MDLTRRKFLEACAASGAALLAAGRPSWAFDPLSVETR